MIPFLDKTAVKIGLTITLLGLLIGFYKWHHDKIFEAGANSVRAELMKEYEKRETELNEKLNEALTENKKEKENASRIQDNLRKEQIKNRKLSNEINSATFDCESFGNDFNNLWNKTIGEKPKFD